MQKIIILDIEGTTSSISFVAQVLFPFVRQHVQAYLTSTWQDAQTKQDVLDLQTQAALDANSDATVPIIAADNIESVVKNVHFNMDKDRKMTALKQLQGHMWAHAYKDGTIKGHVYKDAHDTMQYWKQHNHTIFIYSSGSVQAQKLLFEFSEYGNMLPWISGHYDTKFPGLKTDAQSYHLIAQDIAQKTQLSTSDMLFVTDNIAEADAAKQAGILSVLSVREGTMTLPSNHSYNTITSFEQLVNKI